MPTLIDRRIRGCVSFHAAVIELIHRPSRQASVCKKALRRGMLTEAWAVRGLVRAGLDTGSRYRVRRPPGEWLPPTKARSEILPSRCASFSAAAPNSETSALVGPPDVDRPRRRPANTENAIRRGVRDLSLADYRHVASRGCAGDISSVQRSGSSGTLAGTVSATRTHSRGFSKRDSQTRA